jgi:serine/threonine-protein kinase
VASLTEDWARGLGADAPRRVEDRYREVRLLGRGGTGEVRQVVDRLLGRKVAIKTLRPEYAARRSMVRRFIHEAHIVGQLEHPAIVPVHDLGQLPDGQWFLTMTEIRGKDLDKVIRRFHKARRGGNVLDLHDGWGLRRFMDVLRTICGAVGFAHAKGVIHRDLKPENVMIGDFGEVLVVDWGLAKILDGSGDNFGLDDEDLLVSGSSQKTRVGVVAGTPAYMPPEQAHGQIDALGPWTDVWSLGGVLFAMVYGRPPFRGGAREVLEQVKLAPPEPLDVPGVPDALVQIWRKAMSMDPSDRFPDARALGQELADWLEGARDRERAHQLLGQAKATIPELVQLKREAARARQRARATLLTLRPSDPLASKEKAWKLEERAEELAEQVDGAYRKVASKARAALTQVPEHPAARALLADLYRDRAEDAEALDDAATAREYRQLCEEHDDGKHAEYLQNAGRFMLVTEPAAASVQIYRFVPQARRLAPTPVGDATQAPVDMELPAGSYLAVVRAPGCEALRYPFSIQRGRTWTTQPPGQDESEPVRLLRAGALQGVERYVAGGWTVVGGDPQARGSMGRLRVWVPGFVIWDRPVSQAEYLYFLNDLVAKGRSDEARARMPLATEGGDPLVRFESEGWDASAGRFKLQGTAGGLVISGESPVVGVSWHDASAFCVWFSGRTKQAWRLPGELEREKAARGPDERAYPWGDRADPAFHCMQQSALPAPGPPPTDAFPVDCSPYFVHGLAGGVQEWCADVHQPYGPPRKGALALSPEPPDQKLLERAPRGNRSVRGGAWDLGVRASRAASREGRPATRRRTNLGFRIARSL